MESKRIKILAIDDNQDNLISLKALIKEAFPDAKIFTALNGTKGLELAAAEDPDVILLDIIMPGMDGFEVCKKLKADKILCDIPVVFVTAIKGDKVHRILALEVGAEAFLAKPIDATELTAQIRAMVKIKTANNNKRDENERLAALVEKQTGELRKAYSDTLKLLEDLNRENKARKESESQTKDILQTALDGFWILDLKGKFIEVNDVACKMVGYSREEMLKIGISDLEIVETAEQTPKHLQKAIDTGQDRFESKHRCKNGETIDVELSVKMQHAQNLIVVFVRDITERVKNEKRIADLVKRLSLSQEVSNAGSWDWDIQTNIFYWSEEFLKLFGMGPDTVPGFEAWTKSLHHDDIELAGKRIQDAIDQKTELLQFYRIFLPDGSLRWIRAMGTTTYQNDVPIRMIGLCMDVTDQKLTEQALRESEEKFRAVAELSPIAIYASTGSDQKGIFINETFYKIFGFTLEDIPTVGVWWLKAFPDEKYRQQVNDQWVLNIEQAGKNNSDVEALECVCTCKDGSEKNIVWVGKTIGEEFWAFGYDFTERKNAEQELIIAKDRAEESDRLKSAFLANMSHEIRTPMNGILGFSELLKEPGLSGDEQLNYIQIIEKSGKRMLNIINDIVDISKIESGLMKMDIRESNINEQIKYIYTFFKPEVEAKGMKLSFRNSLPSKESIVKTDCEKLYAVLTNLVKNAIKYSEKGLIEFGYDVVETHGRASVHGRASLQMQFYVRDTGIGIPKDRQEVIFERFIQADITDMMARQGAGLGLSISKAYVEMLGGKIWVESEEGIGSTFYFTLPYNAEQVIETINQQFISSGKTESLRKLKILIAEDDEVSGMLIDIAIKTLGKEIIKVRTGIEAVEACRNNPDIDLILMDIQMPVMGGHEATMHIREFNKEVVIIAQTAYGLSVDREKSIKSGCNDYISKPINKNELLGLIQKYFGNN